MLIKENLDNESLLTGPMGIISVEELKEYFLKRRVEDDEFARDYARHEFVNWLNNENYQEII